jgi:hypothetical protein
MSWIRDPRYGKNLFPMRIQGSKRTGPRNRNTELRYIYDAIFLAMNPQ